MILRIVIYPAGGERHWRDRQAQAVEFDSPDLAAGSAPDCEIALPGLPPLCFRLRAAGGRAVTLAPTPDCPPLRVNGALVSGEAEARHGDRLFIGPFELLVVLRELAADRRRHTHLLPLITATLVGLILLAELGLVTWLPRQAGRVELGGLEVTRQRTLLLLDDLRLRIASWPAPAGEDRRARAVLSLVSDDLDRAAGYLRAHAGRLDAPQFLAFHEDFMAHKDTLDRLAAGHFFAPLVELDADRALDTLLPQGTPP